MNMKNKVVNETYDSQSGICTVTIQNKYGHFTGKAKCCPEDMKNFSTYAGSRYAEIRASIKYAKFRLKQEKIKYQTIDNYLKDCLVIENELGYDMSYNHYINHALNLRKVYQNNIKHWEEIVNLLSNSISLQDEERQKVLNRSKQNNSSK